MERLVCGEVYRSDSTKQVAADSVRRLIDGEMSDDRRARAAADIDALCRASTDIFVGTLGLETEMLGMVQPLAVGMDVKARLWSQEQSPLAVRVDSILELPQRRNSAGEQLALAPQDLRLYRCRVQRAAQERISDVTTPPPPTLIMFLKRGPFDPSGSSRRWYRLADHKNGLLPADSTTFRTVREALALGSQRMAEPPTPLSDCGAALADFVGLPEELHARLRCKITCVKRANWSGRVQSFVFGCGGTDEDTRSSVPCAMAGEFYWNDFAMDPYWVPIGPANMSELLRNLNHDFGSSRSVDPMEAAAILSLYGPIDGRQREFEISLGSGDVDRLGAALTQATRGDSLVMWRVNYLKFSFGEPLAPDADWHMSGFR